MMKKTLIAALLPFTMMVTPGVFAEEEVTTIKVNGGTVSFTGSIVNTPCAVENSSEGQTVELGQFRQSQFEKTGDTAEARAFNIVLSDCAIDTYSKASIYFDGVTDGDTTVLTTEGGAEGVGIRILDNASNPVQLDQSAAAGTAMLIEGNNVLNFKAQYISTADSVTPGGANAGVNFLVEYK